MITDEQIIKEAERYLEEDITSIDEASSALGISRRTFQLHMKKLEEIAPETFLLVKAKKEANIVSGVKKGGETGKRGTTWTKEEAKDIAERMISGVMTYREAAEKTGIPSSTIHEMVHKGLDDAEISSLLYVLSEANRRGMSVEDYLKKHRQEHVTSDIVATERTDAKIGRKK